MKIAAVVAVSLLALIIAFQMALALGVPLGKAAWGGQHQSVLPTRLRIFSGVAAFLIYPFIVVAILGSAGVIYGDFLPGRGVQLMWVLVGLFNGAASLTWRPAPRSNGTGPPFR